MQVVLGEQVQSKPKESIQDVKMEWKEEKFSKGKKLDYLIAKYVNACRATTTGSRMWGMATDKAWCHGLPLQATIFSMADNTALLGCPAVLGDTIDMK